MRRRLKFCSFYCFILQTL